MSRFPSLEKEPFLNCKGKGTVIILASSAFSLTMASHPLDIGSILRTKGVETDPPPKAKAPKPTTVVQNHPNEAREPNPVRIRKDLWDQLNQESRRMFTSRIWRGVDFNPMLSELEDLSKLSEKWLKWAVPTYVNGLKSGPIKAWFEGQREAKDFHYVLVGEHLQHLKRVRKNKEQGQGDSLSAQQQSTQTIEENAAEQQAIEDGTDTVAQNKSSAEQTSRLASSLNQLDDHIAWFQAYVAKAKD